jgi:N4-gp56 family major capsid protein
MAGTSFATQQTHEKLTWARLAWKAHREKVILKNYIGVGDNQPIHKVTELTKTEKGDRCIFQLVQDLQEDGGAGDVEREGMEESLELDDEEITIDLLNHGVRNKGKMDDQRSVLAVRDYARERLAQWLADRTDQMLMLALSGIGFEYFLDGSSRPARSKLKNLAFAADVAAPTTKRLLTWNGTTMLGSGDAGYGTANVASTYLPTYKMIVDAGAYMRTHRIKPLTSGGKEYYLMLVHPLTYARLKMDTNFQNALVNAGARGDNNPWFTGADVTVDGMIIRQHNYVYNTRGAASGSKWGAGSAINGTRTLVLGAQAIAYADINQGDWVEKKFQYDSFWGINLDKMLGFKVPKFYSLVDQGVEDFGRVAIDHYIA